jgi:hypothetical protein
MTQCSWSVHPVWLSLFGTLLFAGCGPAAKPTGKLQGAVTFEGTPVKDASIQVQSLKTGAAAAAKVDAGKFNFETPIVTGEYQVSITPITVVPEPISKDGAIPPPPKPVERPDIPEKYRDLNKSGLKVTVKTGDNTFDVDMKK